MYGAEYKKRRPRFSNAELSALVNEVYRNKAVLFDKKCSAFSNEQKSRAWQVVTDGVNKVCLVEPRTSDEVRRKWYYFLSDKKKEIAKQKILRKKTKNTSPSIMYSPNDLKILEILGEIEEGEAEYGDCKDEEENIEGLVCEVDTNALALKSPSTVSANGDRNELETPPKFPCPEVTFQEYGEQPSGYTGAAVNGFEDAVKNECELSEGSNQAYDYDQYSTPAKQARRRAKCDEDDDDVVDGEFLMMEKRRIELQENQLQVLRDIHKQMREDAERNRAFQEAFLEIQRQRLEVKKNSLSRTKQ
ncbi:hypothetical protein SK128_018163 [Halocaridina rubra]|uniref:Regulatory protein zeste n=1 Tax=Halocaridina rubra TaxID=373956 RepID=A0AAN8XP24_HALRR